MEHAWLKSRGSPVVDMLVGRVIRLWVGPLPGDQMRQEDTRAPRQSPLDLAWLIKRKILLSSGVNLFVRGFVIQHQSAFGYAHMSGELHWGWQSVVSQSQQEKTLKEMKIKHHSLKNMQRHNIIKDKMAWKSVDGNVLFCVFLEIYVGF